MQTIIVNPPESLTRPWVESFAMPKTGKDISIILDCKNVTAIDSAGIAFVQALNAQCVNNQTKLIVRNIRKNILASLSTQSSTGTTVQPPKIEPFFARVGSFAISFKDDIVNALSLLTEMIYWGTIGLARKRTIRAGALGEQMYQLGFKATGLIALLSFLIGTVLALQTAIQLQRFGAGIFLAAGIGISMLREIGPLMTAIILAGRSGSATTAEIATMSVNEELDALQTMGINPVQFVVVPKFWAITVTMPLLTVLASVTGILGGFVVALIYLDISPTLFLGELIKNIYLDDVLVGVAKSVVFAWLIVWIGATFGFSVRGGAEEVGRQTTSSVVTAIFMIIIADAVFSFVF